MRFTRKSPRKVINEILRETGFVQTGPDFYDNDALKYIHDYLNVLPYEGSLQSENYFIRLLVLLDRRLGKRRLKKILENIKLEPEWSRKWVMLRGVELGKGNAFPNFSISACRFI